MKLLDVLYVEDTVQQRAEHVVVAWCGTKLAS
jgi:hypothetical protein